MIEGGFSIDCPLNYAHIPKSGGTTFTLFLERLFDVNQIFQPHLLWEVGAIEQQVQKKYGLFRGHFNALGHILAYQKTHNMTLIRHPFHMAVSSYEHVKRDPATKWHDVVVGEQWSFEDFIDNKETQNLVANRMCKFLQLGSKALTTSDPIKLNVETFRAFKRTIKEQQGWPNIEEKAGMAKEYINTCIWAGVLEEFEDSMAVLCYLMALPPVKALPKLNASHSKEEWLTPKAKEKLGSLNVYDLELYACAVQKLKTQKAVIEASIKKDLDWVSIDEHYQNQYLKIHKKKTQSQVSFEMSQAMLGDQWYEREREEESGEYFRWSGPGSKPHLDFWIEPGDYRLNLILKESTNINELVVRVNGKKWPYHSLKTGTDWCLQGDIDEAFVDANGLLRIQFAIKENSLQRIGKPYREVGIALKQVIIE